MIAQAVVIAFAVSLIFTLLLLSHGARRLALGIARLAGRPAPRTARQAQDFPHGPCGGRREEQPGSGDDEEHHGETLSR